MCVRFGVLGPVEAWDGERRLAIGGPQQRGLLAALLLNADRVVSVDRLVDYLWGEQPPATARGLLQGCVAGLRRVLREAGADRRLETAPPGYRLRVAAGELDLDRFEELASQAHRTEDPVRAAELCSEALALWRGPALDGVDSNDGWGDVARLEERRLAVLEQRIDADLRVGRPAELIGELQAHVKAHPLRERPWAQLMRALYQAGRRADALAAYQQLRNALVDTLGVEPAAAVQQLHRAILAGGGDPLDGQPAGTLPAPVARLVPAQLPVAPAAFTGRDRQLKELDELLSGPDDEPRIAVISGMAGAGKTALAVHWAQQARDRLPDGQLYANLRGFDPGGSAATPAEVLRGFLGALPLSPDRIPTDPPAQAGLYRSLTSGRRMVILLDNARDAQQVRQLLPGGPGSVVLVTSRHRLSGLVAAEGAKPVALGPLPTAEARDMLSRRLGAARIAGEPEAVADIVDRCAGLPLALAVVAARSATHPNFPLAAIAAELPDAPGAGLDAFAGDDEPTDLRAVFSWSYRALSNPAARVFRLLGLHPGPEIGGPAAASLAGLPVGRVGPLLTELASTHLLDEPAPGRYAFHDLLRAYAAELAGTRESAADRHAAQRRLLDHYLHTAIAADRLIDNHRKPVDPGPATPGVTPEDLADSGQALAWFTAEHRVLVASVELAGASGFDHHARHLPWAVANYLQRFGRWYDWAAVHRVALEVARQSADRSGQATAHRDLARAKILLGRYTDAQDHCQRALDLLGELGDAAGQGHTLLIRSVLGGRLGDRQAALHDSRQALERFRVAGDRAGQATATNNIGWSLTLLGDHEQALPYCQQALAFSEEFGDDFSRAANWDSLGLVHRHLGHHDQAVACYRRSVALIERFGDHFHHAHALVGLGETYRAAGQPAAARGAWRQAVTILDQVGHADADQVRRKISQLSEAVGPDGSGHVSTPRVRTSSPESR